MIVLDASVCAPWFLPDEVSGVADRAAEELIRSGAAVPTLWQFEIRNILLTASRRKRFPPEGLPSALSGIAALRLMVDADPDWSRVVALALRHGLTIYDASYLELAERRGMSLATLDRRLAEAAGREGVPLLR